MRIDIFILSLLFSISAFSQVKIALWTGYGTYSMNQLKTFQQELLDGFPKDAKITESFPGYVNYELSVITKTPDERFILGGFLNYGSSGGRIHYEDYSGEVSSNQLVHYFALGANLGIKIPNTGNSFRVYLDLRPQATYSALTIDFYSRLGTQSEKEFYKFNSLNFAAEPGVFVDRRLMKNWGVGLFAGYNISLKKGQLFFKEDDQAYLQNANGDDIHTNWSGFRIALGVTVEFGNN